MKTRILAVLLAVCMIAGSCVLFASAANVKFSKNEYVELVDETSGRSIALEDGTHMEDLKKTTKTELKVTPKEEDASVSVSVATVANKKGTLSIANLKKICDLTGTSMSDAELGAIYGVQNVHFEIDPATMTATVTGEVYVKSGPASDVVYKVTSDIDTDPATIAKTIFTGTPESKYTVKTTPPAGKTNGWFIVSNVEIVEKLFDLQMFLRFYGDGSYKNLSSSEIADIRADYTAIIRDKDGKQIGTKPISVHVDKLTDLLENTKVTLTAGLKDDKYASDYQFSYWVDGSGTVLGKSRSIEWTAGTGPSPIYAVFTELKSRVRINYSTTGNGTVAYVEADAKDDKIVGRDILGGEQGQISVMEGRKVVFAMKPDEGYEVAHVYVDRDGSGVETDVAGFLTLLTSKDGNFFKALKELINATNKDVYKFTFTKADLSAGLYDKREGDYVVFNPRSIRVVFQRIENFTDKDGNPVITGWELEPHAQLEPIKAEGLELETGAAAAAAANGGEANPAGAAAGGTTLPAEDGAAGSGASAISGVINPATGSTGAIAVFAALFAATGVAVVTVKKKED